MLPPKRVEHEEENRFEVSPSLGQQQLTPRELLVDLALEKALDALHKVGLVAGHSLVIVLVPRSEDWVRPLAEAIRELSSTAYILARGSVPKEMADPALVDRLMSGRPVVGISPSPRRQLPKLLLDSAHRHIDMEPLTWEMLETVAKRFLRGPIPAEFAGMDVSSLGLDELAGLIANGANAGETLHRIRKLLVDRTLVDEDDALLPHLKESIEYGEAQTWALHLRDDIADMRRGAASWTDIDRGCLLFGPPGTGKTMLARMLGRECGIPTIVASLADHFVGGTGYLDSVLKKQRQMFEEARSKAPCILFIDEINALPNVDTLDSRNRDYWMPVILDFYTQLDGALSDRDGVIVVGATNRIEDINGALLRPGRLERSIYVGPPDAAGSERIMRYHLAGALADVDISTLASINADRSATGAIIMEQCRAARRTARRAGREMVLDDLRAQVMPIDERSSLELRRTAIHEAGHALIPLVLGRGEVNHISIVLDGASGGSTSLTTETIGNRTLGDIEDIVTTMLAGRAAEEVMLGAVTMGAGGDDQSDLSHATRILVVAFASSGLGGSLVYRGGKEHVQNLLMMDREFRLQIDGALARLYERATVLIREHADSLDLLVDALMTRRFMTGEEVRKLVGSISASKYSPDPN